MKHVFFDIKEFPNHKIPLDKITQFSVVKGFRYGKEYRKCKIKNGKPKFYTEKIAGTSKSIWVPAKVLIYTLSEEHPFCLNCSSYQEALDEFEYLTEKYEKMIKENNSE